MPDIDDNILRKAHNGDKDSILAVLRSHDVPPDLIGLIDGSWGGDFAKRVAAIKYKKRRRLVGVSLPIISEEISSRFGFPINIARHLAYGKNYKAEQNEAKRQLEDEAELSNE